MSPENHLLGGMAIAGLMAVSAMACALWQSREDWRAYAEDVRRQASDLHAEVCRLRTENLELVRKLNQFASTAGKTAVTHGSLGLSAEPVDSGSAGSNFTEPSQGAQGSQGAKGEDR